MQETRKDPRAKVLSMTVRYKSATLDEFIEHHSHDVSRGGMFIKTPSPFPPGTLLKFEVRISEEQKVMQGVGRVVWKRDSAGAGSDAPAGMGVKFIKLDDESKQVIDHLVGIRGGADGAYEVGEKQSPGAGPGSVPPTAPAVPRAEPRAGRRQGTMLGLGAVKLPETSPTPPPAAPGATGGAGGFFPQGPAAEQPNPEDRTVMRQAAELLREALREAGGSMDEVTGGAPSADAGAPAEPAQAAPPVETSVGRKAEEVSAPAPTTARSAPAPAPALHETPAAESEIEFPKKSGGSKALWMLLAAVALGAGIFFITQQKKPEAPLPVPTTPPAAVAPPEPTHEPSAAPVESTAPAESASAAPSASAEPAVSAEPAETPAQKAAREKTEAAAQKAEEAAAKKAAAAAAAEAKKAEAAAAAEAKKAAAVEAAASQPKPKPAPKPSSPKPAPKPAENSDNPY